MPPAAAESPRHQPARTVVLAGIVGGSAGARRAFVDATGTPLTLPATIRRIVATDETVGALLLDLGAPMVGCAGTLDGVEAVGVARSPDARAVAALRPDVIVSGVVGGAHDLENTATVDALRRVAPVVAVDLGRRAAAAADLRALLGPVVGGGTPATEPVSDRRVGAP